MYLLCKSGSEGRFKGAVVAVSHCKHCDLKAASDKSGFIGSAERSGCPTGKAKGWAGVLALSLSKGISDVRSAKDSPGCERSVRKTRRG